MILQSSAHKYSTWLPHGDFAKVYSQMELIPKKYDTHTVLNVNLNYILLIVLTHLDNYYLTHKSI